MVQKKTADALHLPNSLEVYGAEVNGEKTTFSASVKWDVENCAYDPKSKAAQSFLVNGSLELNEDEIMKAGHCRTDNGTGGCLSDIKQTSY